jgi:hypothetical protein
MGGAVDASAPSLVSNNREMQRGARIRVSDLNAIALEQVPGLAWGLLQDGARRGRAAFHTPVLASLRDGQPQARTVVLRVADPTTRELICHTDQRSPKIRGLEADGAVVWVFYDPAAKLQLRMSGQVTLHHDDELSASRWAASRPGSKLCYQNPYAPGAQVESPESAHPERKVNGYANFTALRCAVERFDWLYLDARGHRRACFDWHDGGWRGSWLAP